MAPRLYPIEKTPLTVAHISDFHIGSYHFVANLMNRTILELNELKPDVIIITGDLTNEGFRQEYITAKAYLDELECEQVMVVPGNHDSRNVGYLHFDELFGPRFPCIRSKGICIVGADSSEPDLDAGKIGRERYAWIMENYHEMDDFKVFALHHHLLPVPGTGRERNIVYDAGDILEILFYSDVDLVLTGHKHVPYVWRLENMYVVNAGTVSSLRLRGHTKPCYNVIEIREDLVRIFRKYPFGGKDVIAQFGVGVNDTQRKMSGAVREIIGMDV
ncbi:MAG: metallophosphoesterase family protein [Actinomycetota bacterium]